MGTRSTYRVIETYEFEEKRINNKLVHVYFQLDGYPSGHPSDVAEWLSKGTVVNGIGMQDGLLFNGAGCLAAQFVAKFKKGMGGVYIQFPQSFGKSWENYLYDIVVDVDLKTIKMICYTNYKRRRKIFEGTPQEFIEWAKTKE